jgi:N-acyl-D-aspartate/D-glutamate deacylase
VLDLVLRGALVYDGSGRPPQSGDLGIRDGRVASIAEPGTIDERARSEVDLDGLAVLPGFIDVHTHHDAQVFWDPACTPSSFHGVTTVIAGNCGFSLAPLPTEDPTYLMRMMARVEGIPLPVLEAAVPWSWSTTEDYLSQVEQCRPALNVGFMVGHSALRQVVMGPDGVGGTPSAQQLATMCGLLKAGIAAGGFGFSSSWAANHFDGEGSPVPSRASGADELLALCASLRGTSATQVEFIGPGADGDEIMVEMALAAGLPVNWNVLMFRTSDLERAFSRLALSDEAARRGARISALSYPAPMELRISFRGTAFQRYPGWAPVLTSPLPEQLAIFSDPEQRRRLAAAAASVPDALGHSRWGTLTVGETFHPSLRVHEGRRIEEIAADSGKDPFDVLCDIAVADELRTVFLPMSLDDDRTWAAREASWSDPRVVLGASDAGAHVETIHTYDWATTFLALNRERGVMAPEQAVRRVTSWQADLYGLEGRGRIEVGAHADLVVVDMDRIGPGNARTRADLPGGVSRLYSEPEGIQRVFVAGTEIVVDNELTGARPGTVLRSGRDTRLVEGTSR